MTPLPNQPEGTPKFRYNEALCKARNPIERLFGVLKGTWRCLSQHRTLQYEPGFAGNIVNACAILHNIRLGDQTNENTNLVLGPLTDDNPDNISSVSSAGKRVQERLVNTFFS